MNIISNPLRAVSRGMALVCAVSVAFSASSMQAQSLVTRCKDYCSYVLPRLPFASAISAFVQKHRYISLSLAVGTAAMFVIAALVRSKGTSQHQQEQLLYSAFNASHLHEQKEKEKNRKIKIMLQRGKEAQDVLSRANELKNQDDNFAPMVRQLDAVASLMQDHVGDAAIAVGTTNECGFFDQARTIEDCLQALLKLVKELEPNTQGATKNDIKNLCKEFYEAHYKKDVVPSYVSSALVQDNARELLEEWNTFYDVLKAKAGALYALNSAI